MPNRQNRRDFLKFLFLISIIFFCGHNLSAQLSVIKEEYDVYAIVLKDIRIQDIERNKSHYSFVILNNTYKPEYFSEYEKGRFKSLSEDFVKKNSTSAKLEKLFPVSYEYELNSHSEIEDFLKIGGKELEKLKAEAKLRNIGITDGSNIVWKHFYTKYPNANGYYQFSRVGFTTNKRFAFVTVEGTGAYWSSTNEYILKKVREKWIIYFSGGGFKVA